jgi:hypothetical protein
LQVNTTRTGGFNSVGRAAKKMYEDMSLGRFGGTMNLESASCILAALAAYFHFADLKPWFKTAKWFALGSIAALQMVIYFA